MRETWHIRNKIHYTNETEQTSNRQMEGGLKMVPGIQGWRIGGLLWCRSETPGKYVFKMELPKQSMGPYTGDPCTIYRRSAV